MKCLFRLSLFLTLSLSLLITAALLSGPALAGGTWLTYSVNCQASQQHALHRDSDGTLWAGCGSGASGFGVHRSIDGGQTWQVPTTNPAGIIDTFRVNDIKRGHDGALYLAGTISQSGTQNRVIRLDTSTAQPYAAEATLIGVATVGFNFIVGHYAELDDGQALASSQTGVDKLYRSSPLIGNSAADWFQPTGIEAFSQLVAHDGGFYASGSRINIAPRVFLPPQAPGAQAWDLVEVILDNSFDGEMWGIAANDQRVVAVGLNQDTNRGKIYVSSKDPYDPADYTVHEFRDDGQSWAHGVCMRDNRIVVVGRRLPSGSRVLASNDGGQTFFDASPAGSALLSQCVIAPTGLVTVFGSGGFIGVWDGLLAGDNLFSDRFEN